MESVKIFYELCKNYFKTCDLTITNLLLWSIKQKTFPETYLELFQNSLSVLSDTFYRLFLKIHFIDIL